MKNRLILFKVLVLAMILNSCGDKEHPEIFILSPAEGAHYSQGAWFNLTTEVKDDRGLYQVREYIGNEEGLQIDGFPGEGTLYNMSGKKSGGTSSFNLPTDTSGTFWVHVEAIDDDGKVSRKQVKFFIDP